MLAAVAETLVHADFAHLTMPNSSSEKDQKEPKGRPDTAANKAEQTRDKKQVREEKLAEALRANLRRRKK